MSSTRQWTTAQQSAIDTIDRSVLVSAAAGSGKTAVLAERCAHLVCSAPKGKRCGVDELLVVTFTEAAAAEMKSRIAKAIRLRAGACDDPHIIRQVAAVDRASVSTLHGFCAKLLRQHFHVAEIDPSFDVIDGDEAALLRREVVEELLSDAFEHDDSGAIQRLVDACFDGNDSRLADVVLSTHELLTSLIAPEKWLEVARRRVSTAADGPIQMSDFGKVYTNEVRKSLASLVVHVDAAIGAVRQMPGLEPYLRHLEQLRGIVLGWTEAFRTDGLDALAELVVEKLPTLPPVRGAVPGKEQAKSLIDAIKKQMGDKGIGAQLRFTWDGWQRGMAAVIEPTECLLALVEGFGQRYRDAKAELRALDFSDLERHALKVLAEPSAESLRPSSVARSCHRRFKYVLVDEAQDINELQDALLRLLSRECISPTRANLFSVGDVKQSIYRFRLANPRLFQQRRRELTAPDSGGEVIDLRENFRSRAPLLNAINAVFERLMSKELDDLPYDESQRLVPGAVFPSDGFVGAPVELHLLPDKPEDTDDDADELERIEREAWLVVARISDLMGGDGKPKAQVTQRRDPAPPVLRDVTYADIAILLRAKRYKADQFAAVLRQAGIPVHAEGGTGFFGAQEIRDILALLHVLDNPQQDLPLAALLRSPLVGLAEPEDSLARLRLAYSKPDDPPPFHRTVRLYASEHDDELAAFLKGFWKRIDNWREQAQTRPLAEVIWSIYETTGYLVYCAGLVDGRQRRANLMLLHRRAAQFDSFRRQGLARFINFLDSLESETDAGQAPVATEAGDAVRIMTIHQSKGLEFPVVIVPDMGKAINLSDCHGPILIHREAGVGIETPDFERRARYPSLAWTVIEARHRTSTMAEELRVLYVAMTRAKEHLILVGTAKADCVEQWKARWSTHDGPLPVDHIVGSRSMLEWLGPIAVSTTSLSPPPLEIVQHASAPQQQVVNARSLPPEAAFHKLAKLEPLPFPPPTDPAAEAVMERINFKYPYRELTKMPASQPVTSVGHARASRDHEPKILALRKPSFADATISAADVGTATHIVLQHLRFDRHDVESQIEQMVQRRILTAAQAKCVDRDCITWLLGTDLGRSMAEAGDQLLRELPIYLALPGVPTGSTDDQIMLRGRLDAFVPGPDGGVIVDYKTDKVTPETVRRRADEYRGQMAICSQALEKITGRKPVMVCLVFLSLRDIMRSGAAETAIER